jgi:hypothetical protein
MVSIYPSVSSLAQLNPYSYTLYMAFNCSAVPRKLLSIRDVLKLGGDFKALEALSGLIREADATRSDMPLSVITNDVQSVSKHLANIDQNDKHGALKALLKHANFVCELTGKSMFPSLSELNFFVDLASDAAGDDIVELKNIEVLQDVGTAYGPLLYLDKERSGWREIYLACKYVYI